MAVLVLFFLIGIIALIIFSLVVYTYLYNRKIKQVFEAGDTSGRQWPAPKNVIGMILIIILILYGIISIVHNSEKQGQTGNVSINYEAGNAFYTADTLKGTYAENYVQAFETGMLTGYEMTEKTEGNFHYMCFLSSDDYDSLHPGFILFIEYIGNEEYEAYRADNTEYINDNNNFSYSDWGEASEYYCVIGNIDFDKYEKYSCTLALYDTSKNMEEDIDTDELDYVYDRAEEKITFFIRNHELWTE